MRIVLALLTAAGVGTYLNLAHNKYFNMACGGSSCKKDSTIQQQDAVTDSDLLSKPIFKNGCYSNPWKTWREPTFSKLFKFIFREKDLSDIPDEKKLAETLPVHDPDLQEFEKYVPSGVRTMWIGHASVLVKFDNITILTDPQFSERSFIFQFAGPKRYRKTPCKIKDLPKIDAVVISHNHYDHLDYHSVKELNEKYGKDLRWYVPQGMKQWMSDTGCENVIEMTWWEKDQFPGKPEIKFVSVPAQHWSKRTITDTNKALWCGWAVVGPNNRFFFAGDTGYCEAFKEIGSKYGPFTLAAIPIGAYHPRSFLNPQHVDPAQAVDIHVDIQAKNSLGIHWGTFRLTVEPYLEPKEKIEEELALRQMNPNEFITLEHGEIKTFGIDTYREMD